MLQSKANQEEKNVEVLEKGIRRIKRRKYKELEKPKNKIQKQKEEVVRVSLYLNYHIITNEHVVKKCNKITVE